MKTTLSFLLLFFLSLPFYGQQKQAETLVVSSISDAGGYLQKGKKRVDLKPGTTLSSSDIIALKPGATMVAVTPSAGLRYTFKGAYTGVIKNYIKQNEKSCVKVVTSKYMNYLLEQAFRGRRDESGAQEDNEATVFRKVGLDSDSVTMSLKSIDSLYTTIDSLSVLPTDSIR